MRRGPAAATAAALLLATSLAARPLRADETSSADKLRVLWSPQFEWTRDGRPLVAIGLAEGLREVQLGVGGAGAGGGLRVLPDGEGGAEVRAGARWTVRVEGGRPAKVRWNVVVARFAPSEAERLRDEMESWRGRGYAPRRFEVGALFGRSGDVVDGRRLLVALPAPDPGDEAAAKQEAARVAAKFAVETSLHPEVTQRPRGTLVAVDERGTQVRNDDVVWLAPADPQGLVAVDVPRAGGAIERRTYAGKIYVTVDAKGSLAVVNAVPEDRLLAGLLPAEMGAGAPPEALKAQAVAARNILLAKIGTRHFTEPYRLCSSVHCQVYAGAGREDARSTAAVTATSGELLVRPDGTLVDAVYSASCGGHTEDNDRAWGVPPDPALRGRIDGSEAVAAALAKFHPVVDVAGFLAPLPAPPACAAQVPAGAKFRWSVDVPAATVEAGAFAGLGHLREVRVEERGVSGRAIRVALVFDGGTREIVHELEIRRAFGNLKSALFTLRVERTPDGHLARLHFDGGGHGHGVGMCQTGAMSLAQQGLGYREILAHYYTATTLRKLY